MRPGGRQHCGRCGILYMILGENMMSRAGTAPSPHTLGRYPWAVCAVARGAGLIFGLHGFRQVAPGPIVYEESHHEGWVWMGHHTLLCPAIPALWPASIICRIAVYKRQPLYPMQFDHNIPVIIICGMHTLCMYGDLLVRLYHCSCYVVWVPVLFITSFL